jgi:hypothetical protein
MNLSQDARRPPSSRMRVTAAIIGNALEFYDFTVYGSFATWLAKAFFPANNPKVSLLHRDGVCGRRRRAGGQGRYQGGGAVAAPRRRFGRADRSTDQHATLGNRREALNWVGIQDAH